MYSKLSYLIIALLLLLPFSFFAQGNKYVFNRLSVKDGLASNHVYTILQDAKGFMWFGTAGGLQRFDGKKVVMFRSRTGTHGYLPSNGISQIFEDVQHNFWVRYGGNIGIFDPITYRFKEATVKPPVPVPPRAEYGLWSDSRGNIFLIITQCAVLSYNPVTNTFAQDTSKLRLPPNRKLLRIQEDPRTGNYWLGTDSGLAVYDIHSGQLHYTGHLTEGYPVLDIKELNNPVTAFFIDKEYKFWVITWGIVNNIYAERYYCYDLAKGHAATVDMKSLYAHPEYYKELHNLIQQSNGRLWAYGRMMFLEFLPDQKQFQYLRNDHMEEYGLKYDIVYCAYEDREKNIWLGTDEGIYVFNPDHQLFTNTTLPLCGPLKQVPPVTAFLETRQKKLLVASWGYGTFVYDSLSAPTVSHNISKEVPSKDRSYFLHWGLHEEKRNGLVWIACQGSRLILFDPQTKKTHYYIVPAAKGSTLRLVCEDNSGNIWLATQSGNIIKWDPASGYDKNFLDGFKVMQSVGTIIYKIKFDDAGFLWVCTHMKGLYKIDPSNGKIIEHYTSEAGEGKSLQSNFVSDVILYNDTLAYLSTGGLDKLNIKTGTVQSFTIDDGLPSLAVRTLEQDKDNNIWIGLQNALCRYNPRKNTFTQFAQKDGITETDFEYNATLRMNDGTLLFGNPHNFISFQPKDLYNSSVPPDVTITDFKLFNTYLPPDSIRKIGKVELNHTQNSITIEFAALSFLQRDKISYYYKLEGIDDEWIRTERGLFATYNLLPPGHYTFKVASENAEGIGSENITSLPIHIRPPFWRTWWFLSLLGIAIGALIYFIHRMRVNRLLGMEKVRSRIARDLHDDMGSTLSTINILSVMAKMKVNNDTSKTSEYLQKISDNSNRMMEAMDDIVWSINPMNDSMQRIAARMREFATGVLEAKNIDFTFKVDEQVKDLKLDMEARRDIFLIFKEAVNNLAKYAQCKRAAIEISIQKNTMLMKIEDDGTGFDINTADSGNGLNNMKKRAQSLRASLHIHSQTGKGTTVLLKVPLT
ncbi:MAG: two-component regulator propeller domain-containing protein [Chitinophagaceae bacterium]